MTVLAPQPTAAAADQSDEPAHVACPCAPDVALCGEDVSDQPWADDGEEPTRLCVVCVDLEEQPCPRCGQ